MPNASGTKRIKHEVQLNRLKFNPFASLTIFSARLAPIAMSKIAKIHFK